MALSRPLRLAPEWDDRFGRMLAVSAAAHVLVLGAVLLVGGRSAMRPLPLVAYTVELTDPSALGGRVPPGPPAADLSGGPARPPTPEPKGEPAAPPPPEPEPKPEAKVEPKAEPKPEPPAEPVVRIPEKPKPVEPKPPEPKPEPKKPEPAKVEVPKPEPKKPEPAKAEPPKPASEKPPAKAEPKPPATPSVAKAQAAKPGSPAGVEDAPPRDAYAAAAERWRSKAGGGLGGTDEGSGPIGSGGEGKGGGGELVGLEFIAYKQQVINTVRASWTNFIGRPGLLAIVTFEIGPDGEVSNPRLTQSSGNPAYDASALRAVQHTTRLPPPPPRYVNDFREFIMRFRSEDPGGQGAG